MSWCFLKGPRGAVLGKGGVVLSVQTGCTGVHRPGGGNLLGISWCELGICCLGAVRWVYARNALAGGGIYWVWTGNILEGGICWACTRRALAGGCILGMNWGTLAGGDVLSIDQEYTGLGGRGGIHIAAYWLGIY